MSYKKIFIAIAICFWFSASFGCRELIGLPANTTTPSETLASAAANTPAVIQVSTPQPLPTPTAEPTVISNGRKFTIEEINAEIKKNFVFRLFYDAGEFNCDGYEDEQKCDKSFMCIHCLLGEDIEYDVYFEPNSYKGEYPEFYPPTVYVLVTNMRFPSYADAEKKIAYFCGIPLTEWGLRSRTCSGYWVSEDQISDFRSGKRYLGHYTMRIDEIVKPEFEVISAEWAENVGNSIRLCMDENENGYLPKGRYKVYVPQLFRSDRDGRVIFEHENGDLYSGALEYIHGYSGLNAAYLNKVNLVEEDIMSNGLNIGYNVEAFRRYFEKVKADPAVYLEYEVTHQPRFYGDEG